MRTRDFDFDVMCAVDAEVNSLLNALAPIEELRLGQTLAYFELYNARTGESFGFLEVADLWDTVAEETDELET